MTRGVAPRTVFHSYFALVVVSLLVWLRFVIYVLDGTGCYPDLTWLLNHCPDYAPCIPIRQIVFSSTVTQTANVSHGSRN